MTKDDALQMAIEYAEETISLVNIEYETALHSGKKYAIDEAKKVSDLNHNLINACKDLIGTCDNCGCSHCECDEYE